MQVQSSSLSLDKLAHLTKFGLRPCVKTDPGEQWQAFPVPSYLSQEKSVWGQASAKKKNLVESK